MFPSKSLTPAERNYRPTELKVGCLVRTLKRNRHLVQSAKDPPIVHSDHCEASNLIHVVLRHVMTMTDVTEIFGQV
jgi:reverse transcriptase-like protein